MDHYGQPLQWFTVNHWVSGEQWGGKEQLLQALDRLQAAHTLTLVENWLLYMLKAYRQELDSLLQQRDDIIKRLERKQPRDTVFTDRNVYGLSSLTIELLRDLQPGVPE